MARVLLFTEETILAESLMIAIGRSDKLELEWVCQPPDRLEDAVARRNPDVVLVDFAPEECLGALLGLQNIQAVVSIVLWVRGISFNLAYQVMRLGVRGVLRKSLGIDLTVKCLETVAAGECWFDQDLTEGFLAANTVELTRRESQLVALVSQGLKYKEIAAALSLAEGTVRMYLSALFRKVGVKDRYELAIFGLRNLGLDRRPAWVEGTSDAVVVPHIPLQLRSVVLEKPRRCPQPAADTDKHGLTVVAAQKRSA